MQDGVIANFDATERMLTMFFNRIVGSRVFFKPRAVVAVPSMATEVEKRAVIETTEGAGARYTFLIEEPVAGAIGAGIDITEPKGNIVVDIGAGTCDMVVTSMGKAVIHDSLRIGGDKFDAAIVRYFKRQHGIVIGLNAAEQLKIQYASAYPRSDELKMDVRGRSLGGGLPVALELGSNELTYALSEPLHNITEALKDTFEQTPPELAGDIATRGICLTGGGAQLYGLDQYIAEQTGVPCWVAEDPGLKTGRSIVFQDLSEAKNKIEQDAYLRANLKYSFPSKITIALEKRVPAACVRWGPQNEYIAIIDSSGIVLNAEAETTGGLIVAEGMSVTTAQNGKALGELTDIQVASLIRILSKLEELDLLKKSPRLTRIDMSELMSISMSMEGTNYQIEVGDTSNLDTKLILLQKHWSEVMDKALQYTEKGSSTVTIYLYSKGGISISPFEPGYYTQMENVTNYSLPSSNAEETPSPQTPDPDAPATETPTPAPAREW